MSSPVREFPMSRKSEEQSETQAILKRIVADFEQLDGELERAVTSLSTSGA